MTTMHVTPQPHSGNWGLRLLHWTPRVLGILFVAFLAIFALDVFDMGLGFWDTLVALTMHLLPNFVLLAIVILAWRWPWVGGVGFLGFAAVYIATFRGFDWLTYVLIAGIPTLIGLLYLADWYVRRRPSVS
jgi:hypothetical protein